jgi:F-type H+-transporting ATPase subunit delta
MKISAKKYALALYQSLTEKNEKEAKEIITKFVKILSDNYHLAKGKKIVYYLEQLYKKDGVDLELECLSARSLNSDLVQKLTKHFKATKTKEETNKDLLGGIILRYQDKIIDASLKTRLNNLNKHLKI